MLDLTNELSGAERYSKPSVVQSFKNFLQFMESEVSLPHSQEPSTVPYPESDQINLNIINPSMSWSS
jgi:hypothetical protein